MKKRIRTYSEKEFAGYLTQEELENLRLEAHKLATDKQNTEQADHMIYGYYTYDTDEAIPSEAHLYSGIPKTDEEYQKDIATIPAAKIYAIHKR